jgi:hypothetical protein
MGAPSEIGTALPSGAPEFTQAFHGVLSAQSLLLNVVFYEPQFVILAFFLLPWYHLSFD